MYPFYFSIF